MKGYPALPLILAALLLATLPASAQTAVSSTARTKVGLLDVDRVLRDSSVAQQAQVRIREEFAVRDQELAKMSAELKAMRTQLDSNALTMSDSERQTREGRFNDARLALQRQQRAFDEDTKKRRDEELSGMSTRMLRAVRQIAESEKFDVIFREVTWGSPRIDITDKVIKAIDDSRPDAR